MINFLKVILVQQLATGHTHKSNTTETNPDQISGQCALIFPLERGTSFTSDPQLNYCTMSLSLTKNHAHQSQTSFPVTSTIAKRKRSFGVDNVFEPHETCVGMYHIDNII